MRLSSFDAPGSSSEIPSGHHEPARVSSQPSAAPAVPVQAGTMIPHVLLVCMDTRLRDQLGRAASEIGCAFTSAESAEAALRLLSQQPQDIAVIDLDLRSGANADLLSTIRQRWSWVQIILIGGLSEDDSTRHAIRFGVTEFLSKPCSQREVVAAMTRAFRKRVQESGASPAQAIVSPPSGTSASPTAVPAMSATIAAIANSRASSLGELERLHILAALQRNGGNRETAAAELGISVRKLYYRLQQYHREGLIS